jgi:hypothetical protein
MHNRANVRITFTILLIILVACTKPLPPLKASPQPPKSGAEPWGKNEAVVSFAAVGDILMHQAVKDAAASSKGDPQGYDALWHELKDEFSQADWAFANLETPVAPNSNLGTAPFLFNADPAMLKSLQALGIDQVSFANNHSYDQGRPGMVETLSELRKLNFDFIGAGDHCAQARSALIRDIKGIKIGFIGATALFNNPLNTHEQDPCVNAFTRESAIQSVQEARRLGAEFIIYSLHWGVEYQAAPSQTQIDDAHALMDAGVDVLLGHHPHVLQPIEVHQTPDQRFAVTIYSLGNFISNQSRFYQHGLSPSHVGDTRDGVIFRFSAIRKNYGVGKSRVELAQVSAQPLWTENNWLARQTGQEKNTQIRVVSNDERILQLQLELQKTTDESAIIRLKKLLELYQQRHAIAVQRLGEGWMYKP